MSTSRYRTERPLGSGGMGAVSLAYDHALARRVALKRTRRTDPADLLRFKREFRVVEGLRHPNLVRLYELGHDDQGLFYTMEAVDGVDLRRHCAGLDPAARLEELLGQLVAALAFLHQHGVIHCDLKPANVLVTRARTVKLLDFGVLAELSKSALDDVVAGTPAYMAPERIDGAPATPAADLYALGCTIFEVLTERPPFVGSVADVLEAHRSAAPPRLGDCADRVPPALEEACAALLAKDPADRPTLDGLADRLGLAAPRLGGPAPVAGSRAPGDLVGREEMQRALIDALEAPGSMRPMVLSGPSGVGKSALARWLGLEAERRGMTVFRSAARPTEQLAYNALDAAMDDLAEHLHRIPSAVSAGTRRRAAEAFPVLRRNSRSVDEAREWVRRRLFGGAAPSPAGRRDVFEAVGALLDDASRPDGALVVIDDLQWADEDSIALLRHLLEHVGDTTRLLVTLRDDVGAEEARAWLRTERSARWTEVPPLSSEDARSLVRRLAAQLGDAPSESRVAAAAEASGGRPFLIEVAARSVALGAGGTLAEVMDDAWRRHSELLSLLVVADGWMRVSTLAALVDRSLGATDEALAELERGGLVRRARGALDGRADLYHDGVRADAQRRIDEHRRPQLHGRYADLLLAADEAPGAIIVRHLLAAGRAHEAAAHALTAAERASRQRAYGLAAEMYAIVLEQTPADPALRRSRARALEGAGRHADAAAEWATLGASAPPTERLDLALREAHARIAAGAVGVGIRRLEGALADAGSGRLRIGGLAGASAVGRFLLGPARLRPRRVDPDLGPRAERNLKIGILLAFVDPVTGISYLSRARSDFARAGARAQAAGCDYTFAVLALAGARNPASVPLADRYQRAAERATVGLRLPPEVAGMRPFVAGLRAMRRGDWDPARAAFEEAAEIFAESEETTEATMARSWLLMMAAHRQAMTEVRERRDWFRRHEGECGGSLFVTHVGLVDGYIQVLEGRFDEGFATVSRTAELFDEDPPNAQRAALRIYCYSARLYSGDAADTRRALARELVSARRFRFMSSMYAGTYGALLALAEANALRVGDRGASHRKLERLARVVDASPPLCAGSSWRARAYAADARGQPEVAVAHLLRGEREAARFGRNADVAIARWQRGRRIGGDEGAALRANARAMVEDLGVSAAILEEDAGLR